MSGKSVVITATYGAKGGGEDGDLLAWRSEDGGASWLGPSKVNDVPVAAREGLHSMAASSKDGVFAVVWLDLRAKGTQIYASLSHDGGKTWGANVRVYRSPDGTICECCHPTVTFDQNGWIAVMWRNVINGARDMYLSTSADGKNFSAAQKLGSGTWMLNACPMDGGALAFRNDGFSVSLWQRDREVFLCTPGKPERKIGDGVQPWVSINGKTTGSVWLSRRLGNLNAQKGDEPARTLAIKANDPVVVALPGKEARFLAVWQQPAQKGNEIYASTF